MDNRQRKWGYLRETKKMALEAGLDPANGLHRTGLEEYLAVIFPEVDDWIHDKPIKELNGKKCLRRPDYRSERLKLIIEFDGLQHYNNPVNIRDDEEKTRAYEQGGYRVVRIPYFIQLTNEAVRSLFGVTVDEPLFDPAIASMAISGKNTPAFLCPAGIRRMAQEFMDHPEQYRTNLEALKNEGDEFFSGAGLLEAEYERLKS